MTDLHNTVIGIKGIPNNRDPCTMMGRILKYRVRSRVIGTTVVIGTRFFYLLILSAVA